MFEKFAFYLRKLRTHVLDSLCLESLERMKKIKMSRDLNFFVGKEGNSSRFRVSFLRFPFALFTGGMSPGATSWRNFLPTSLAAATRAQKMY